MNSSKDFAKVNQLALEKVNHLKPNFDEFNNGKEFGELYHAGLTFAQTFYYDRTEGGYPGQTNYNLDLDKHEEFVKKVKHYNEKLKEAQKEALDELEIDEYSRRNYFYFNRVGDDIGIAHFHTYVRNQKTDEEERARQLQEIDEEETGPYGGAFRDQMDYIRWREGSGFIKN